MWENLRIKRLPHASRLLQGYAISLFLPDKGALERGQYPGRFLPSSQRCKELPAPPLGAHAPAEPSKQRHLLAGAGVARVLAAGTAWGCEGAAGCGRSVVRRVGVG